MTNRYVKAASNKLYGDVADLDNVDILNCVELDDGGAWVTARIWVHDDELEPESPSAPADAGDSQCQP